jgi:hypothetical protein
MIFRRKRTVYVKLSILLLRWLRDPPAMARISLFMPLGILACLIAGCEAPYSTVKGQVSLDGKPLKGATVGFYPDKGRGSHGVTDDQGRYELRYTMEKPGVPAGKCVVRITTADASHPERLPAKYHESTTLSQDVLPGDNVFNFELQSK